MSMFTVVLLVVVITALVCGQPIHADESQSAYYGELIGALSTLAHGVRGKVYVVDSNRLRLRNFFYDGTGPAAYFWIGVKGLHRPSPGPDGQKIPNEEGSTRLEKRYVNADIVLTLPSLTTVDGIAWLSVWCEQFEVNFGSVLFPPSLQVPATADIGRLENPTFKLNSGTVTILDVVTVIVRSFTFTAPSNDSAIYFIAGNNTGPADNYVMLSNDGNKSVPIVSSSGVDITLKLPSSGVQTILNFQFIGMHSYSTKQTLARVNIPQTLKVPPKIV